MKNLKIVNKEELKDWAKEIFKKNSFNMVDVSKKKETFRRALSCGKIFVGKEVYDLIKSNNMPKGDPISLAEISAVLGVKKTSELIPLCHPLPIDHTATKIVMNEVDHSLEVYCVVSAFAKTGVEMESIMGVNAALTPIIASISTPVFATADTTQKTSRELSSSFITIFVAVWSIGSGWHKGINSLVFLTPNTADTSARLIGSPLGIFLFLIKSKTSLPT